MNQHYFAGNLKLFRHKKHFLVETWVTVEMTNLTDTAEVETSSKGKEKREMIMTDLEEMIMQIIGGVTMIGEAVEEIITIDTTGTDLQLINVLNGSKYGLNRL